MSMPRPGTGRQEGVRQRLTPGRGSDLAVNGQVLPEVLPEPDSVRVFSGFAALSDPAFTGYRRSAAGP